MRTTSKYLLWCFICVFVSVQPSYGQKVSVADVNADWTWVYSHDSLQTVTISDSTARGNWIRSVEVWRRRMRERGLLMFDKYPNDPRRWEWLYHTTDESPFYYVDVDQAARAWDNHTEAFATVDTLARNAWVRRYQALRAMYMASPEIKDSYKQNFLFVELRSSVLPMVDALWRGEPIDSMFRVYQSGLLQYAADL